MDTATLKSKHPAALEARGLCDLGGKRVLLEGFDLELGAGEVHALIGKNGTGKSTLLKVLAGMRAPRSGAVSAHGCRIGALVGEPSFLPELTGLGNAEYLGRMLGIPDPVKEARRVLGLVGLDEQVSDDVAGEYSAGQKQRLGIALALVGNPAVLLLDEPFNAVDLSGVCAIKDALRLLAQRRGTAILITTHVCDHVVGFADRFSFIADRKMAFQASAQQIEELCERHVLLETCEPERALAVLEQCEPGLDAILDRAGGIRIQAKAVPAKLLQELDKVGVAVGEVRSCGESYEGLFRRLSESGR